MLEMSRLSEEELLPRSNGFAVQCLICGVVQSANPGWTSACRCGNFGVDVDAGRLSVEDGSQVVWFAIQTPGRTLGDAAPVEVTAHVPGVAVDDPDRTLARCPICKTFVACGAGSNTACRCDTCGSRTATSALVKERSSFGISLFPLCPTRAIMGCTSDSRMDRSRPLRPRLSFASFCALCRGPTCISQSSRADRRAISRHTANRPDSSNFKCAWVDQRATTSSLRLCRSRRWRTRSSSTSAIPERARRSSPGPGGVRSRLETALRGVRFLHLGREREIALATRLRSFRRSRIVTPSGSAKV